MTAFLPSIADLEPNPTWAKLPLFDRTDCKRVRVSATFAQCRGKSPFRLRGPFPSSGQRELVHPKSGIVLRPRFA